MAEAHDFKKWSAAEQFLAEHGFSKVVSDIDCGRNLWVRTEPQGLAQISGIVGGMTRVHGLFGTAFGEKVNG